MASVRTLKSTGTLFIDFRHEGKRHREYTQLGDTPANRKKLARLVKRLDAALADGTFDYSRFFPNSSKAKRSEPPATESDKNPMESGEGQLPQSFMEAASMAMREALAGQTIPSVQAPTPLFSEFSNDWMKESEVTWRRSYQRTVSDVLGKHLLPRFGESAVGSIARHEILQFRSDLAKAPGRKRETLSPRRINAIMNILGLILKEASDRFQFTCPYYNIKPLKIPKSDVQPFTLEEVRLILDTVREDFRDYFTVRFFTGMRTGEADGLKWEFVDFERRLILVRETRVLGEQEVEAKTSESIRDIQISQIVFDALKRQHARTGRWGRHVFCTRNGQPLDHDNVTKRVWYPLLRYLGLRQRRPYQTRHTAATLWLAAGENPEWIARQMGHTSTEMLFKVYSRYVPNLTRQDGSAFERLIAQSIVGESNNSEQRDREVSHD